MTYPADPTISLRIRDNLLAAVQAIAPPTYRSTVRTARVWDGDVFRVDAYPLVAVVILEEAHDDSRLALVQHTMRAVLVLGVQGASWKDLLDDLIADVRVALTSDHTRGGVAVTTQVLRTRIYDATAVNPTAEAHVEFLVLYRTLYSDPTQAY